MFVWLNLCIYQKLYRQISESDFVKSTHMYMAHFNSTDSSKCLSHSPIRAYIHTPGNCGIYRPPYMATCLLGAVTIHTYFHELVVVTLGSIYGSVSGPKTLQHPDCTGPRSSQNHCIDIIIYLTNCWANVGYHCKIYYCKLG